MTTMAVSQDKTLQFPVYLPQRSSDGLYSFMHYLIKNGDLSALGADAVVVYLVARDAALSMSEHKFPALKELVQKTGFTLERVKQAMQVLEQKGYIQKRNAKYILIDKSALADDAGNLWGELMWQSVTPASLFSINEFKEVFFSGELGGARVINIEHLQVNVTQVQHNNSNSPVLTPTNLSNLSTPKVMADTEAPTMTVNPSAQPAVIHTPTVEATAKAEKPRAPRRILTQVQTPSTGVELMKDVAVLDDIATAIDPIELPPVVAQPVAAPVTESVVAAVSMPVESSSAPVIPTPVVVESVLAPTDLTAERYRRILAEYTQQCYQKQLQSLAIAERATDDALQEILAYDAKRPKEPGFWKKLMNPYLWEDAMRSWEAGKADLKMRYEQVVEERHRLMQALQFPEGGGVPAYQQAAINKVKEQHPDLYRQYGQNS